MEEELKNLKYEMFVTTKHLTRIINYLNEYDIASKEDLRLYITGLQSSRLKLNNAVDWLIKYNLIKEMKNRDYVIYCLSEKYNTLHNKISDRFNMFEIKNEGIEILKTKQIENKKEEVIIG